MVVYFLLSFLKKVLDFGLMLICATLICGVSQTVQTWTLSPSIKPIPALVRTNNSGSRKRTKTRKSYFSSPFETIFAFLPLTVSVIECHNLWTFEGQIGSTPTIQFFLSKKIKEKILNVFHTRLFFCSLFGPRQRVNKTAKLTEASAAKVSASCTTATSSSTPKPRKLSVSGFLFWEHGH